MQAHIVLAHPETLSFNAHLRGSHAARSRRRAGKSRVSDLYAMDFDPLEGPRHYAARSAPERFDAQAEQRQASNEASPE
jgi:NAD(P)H dehydrogenase (quinone)